MFNTTHISHNSYSSCTSHYANKWENESVKTFEHPLSLKRLKLLILNVLSACDEIGFYCSLLWKYQRHVILRTIPIKDMINLWWIVQIVLELLACPFVHGQLWRNIVEKNIRKKTERIWERSIFPSFQAFDCGANVRSFPAESLEMAHHEHRMFQY